MIMNKKLIDNMPKSAKDAVQGLIDKLEKEANELTSIYNTLGAEEVKKAKQYELIKMIKNQSF